MTDQSNGIDAALVAYENRTGRHLTRRERSSLRVLASQQPTERRPSRHPLGHGADPAEDQATTENRAAVKACLRAYWDGSLGDRINQHTDTATGVALADRFVTLLEIGTSLQQLRLNRPDLMRSFKGVPILLIEWRLRDGLTVAEITQRWNMSKTTYYDLEADSIDSLIRVIYDDWADTPAQDSCQQGIDSGKLDE